MVCYSTYLIIFFFGSYVQYLYFGISTIINFVANLGDGPNYRDLFELLIVQRVGILSIEKGNSLLQVR